MPDPHTCYTPGEIASCAECERLRRKYPLTTRSTLLLACRSCGELIWSAEHGAIPHNVGKNVIRHARSCPERVALLPPPPPKGAG